MSNKSSTAPQADPKSFEKRTLANGKANPKYIDVLKQSKTKSGQDFVVLSFLSPENILKQREMFMFEHFVREWDFTKCMEKSVGFINFMAYKYNLNPEALLKDFQEFVK
jgi:hypothetical protein